MILVDLGIISMSASHSLITDTGAFDRSAIMRAAHEWHRRLRHIPQATFASQLRETWRLARKAQRRFYVASIPNPTDMPAHVWPAFASLAPTAVLRRAHKQALEVSNV